MIHADIALGVDIGGTHVRAGAVTSDGRIAARVDARLPTDGDPEPLRRLIAQAVEQLVTEPGRTPRGVGVALPGVWDPTTGILQRALNLPGLEGVNLRDFFKQATGHSVHLESDVNAAGWGQWHRTSPRPRRLVYLALGTGVGGSVILDGEIVRHTRGGAGHFGFLIVDTSPDAPVDRAGIPGCLSAVAAGPALRPTASTDRDSVEDARLPREVLDRAARGLAVALADLAHLYAPDVIALGGGVIDHHPELVDLTRDALQRYRSSLIPATLRIERAPLPSHEAGVIGAALRALQSERSWLG